MSQMLYLSTFQKKATVGFEPTPRRTSALNWRLRPLGHVTIELQYLKNYHSASKNIRIPQVRATSLQELVYKNGQAGITKASVTIVFDNSDKKQTPVGYENFDELTITRQVP